MLKYILTSVQARDADHTAIEKYHIPSLILMEHAAMAAARIIEKRYPVRKAAFVCGPGNNGADGMAAARILHHKGFQPVIYMDKNCSRMSEDQKIQLQAAEALNIPVFDAGDFQAEEELIVDCIFGSGLSRDAAGLWKNVIEKINRSGRTVLSMDIPSGLNGTTGQIMKAAVQADLVMALDCYKTGFFINRGPEICRDIVLLDIGIPEAARRDLPGRPVVCLDEHLAAGMIRPRSPFGHKGTFGRVLLCGGSMSMQGALAMAASACFHAGCGTLSLFTPESAARAIASKMDLAMIHCASEDKNGFFSDSAAGELKSILDQTAWSVIGAGNGMSAGKGSRAVVKTLLDSCLPLVLDADGINCLSSHMEWLNGRKDIILTPHAAEFSRTMNMDITEVLENPFKAADEFCCRYPDAVLVLKSCFTLIAFKDKRTMLCRPNAALAKGGSGDVLCGIITGLYGFLKDPWKAAVLGVWIHSASAECGIESYTFTPLQLIRQMPDALKRLMEIRTRQQDPAGSLSETE